MKRFKRWILKKLLERMTLQIYMQQREAIYAKIKLLQKINALELSTVDDAIVSVDLGAGRDLRLILWFDSK